MEILHKMIIRRWNYCNGQELPQPIADNRGGNSLVPCSALVGLEVEEESTCILIDQEITWLGIYISRTATLYQLTKSLSYPDSDSTLTTLTNRLYLNL